MLHDWIADELRAMALADESPLAMADRVDALLGFESSPTLLMAYFWRAFAVPLPQLAILGAWARFGGVVGDAELDRALRAAIEEQRPLWVGRRKPHEA